MPRVKKIYGGPGTGKTTRLVSLVQEEMENGVDPNRIAYISHTRAAAEEAWERVKVRSEIRKRPKFFCTIHAAARRMTGWPRAKIWGFHEMQVLRVETNMKFRVGAEYDEKDGDVIGDPLLQVINFAKARMVPLEEAMEHFRRYDVVTPDNVHMLAQLIERVKKDHDVKDFDDLLQMYYEAARPIDVRVMFIDEAQDLSVYQWRVVERMWGKCERVYICGDDDQSIYGFMGADPDGFLDYPCDEDEVLLNSWRVPRNIGAYAERIIKPVEKRKQKQLAWRDEDGIIERVYADKDTLPLTAGVETKILVRHQMQARNIYRTLRRDGYSVGMGEESYLNGTEGLVALTYDRMMRGEKVAWFDAIRLVAAVAGREDSVRRMQHIRQTDPNRRIGKDDIALNWGSPLGSVFGHTFREQEIYDSIGLFVSKHGYEAMKEKPQVQVLTMHASKGLEADHVICLTDCYPAVWQDQDGELADTERKVAYVAATRARKRLTLVEPKGDMYCRALVETMI